MSRKQKPTMEPAMDPQILIDTKAKIAKSTGKVSRTIVLTEENDFKLKVLAANRRIDASALVNELITPHLRGIRVSIPRGLPSPALDGLESEDSTAA